MNRKIILKITALLAVLLLVLQTVCPAAYAESDGSESIPLSKCKAYLISNSDGDKILKSSDTEKKISPGSTAKIMSGLLLCEKFASRLDETVTITADMIKSDGGRSAGLTAGQHPTVKDLLYMAFCGCFGDAIRVLAYLEYGSDEGLVAAMNMKAAALGMSSTCYVNATGVYSENMYTTPGDLLKLAVAAKDCGLYMTVTSATAYSTEGLKLPFSFENYNKIIASGSYRNTLCRGMNSGSTPTDGYSLVTLAEKNGVSYICIVLGAESSSDTVWSYMIASQLINWALNSYGTVKLLSPTEVICEIPVNHSVKTQSVVAVPEKEVTAFLPLNYSVGKEITRSYTLNAEELDAPVEAGDPVGTVTVFCDGKEVATVNLIAKSGAEKSALLEAISRIKAFSTSDFFIGMLITAAILVLLFTVIKAFVRGSERKKGHTLTTGKK